jgi:hypothetical protein
MTTGAIVEIVLGVGAGGLSLGDIAIRCRRPAPLPGRNRS